MIDLARERAELAKADACIAAGEERVARQEATVSQLSLDGHDTTEARQLLATFEKILAEWRSHRAQVVRMIGTAKRQDGW
jgi:hypothetical protein